MSKNNNNAEKKLSETKKDLVKKNYSNTREKTEYETDKADSLEEKVETAEDDDDDDYEKEYEQNVKDKLLNTIIKEKRQYYSFVIRIIILLSTFGTFLLNKSLFSLIWIFIIGLMLFENEIIAIFL